ncbi:ribonuclease D [Aquibaculum sediminis]|uniref:ribonuclease D n=1 Tax=Aquibaculum sediminis TaxID=3231907 RepID=UPI0034528E8C
MTVTLHQDDLPADLAFGEAVAVDCETMGLNLQRDRLCLIQLSAGDGNAHLVQFRGGYEAPNLRRLLADPQITKLYHFARFDVAAIERYLEVTAAPIYCTKIASKLVRTFTDRHGLKDLCNELLGVSLSKQQQSSDWGAAELTEEQQRYAASDVLHLHALRQRLNEMLEREGRRELAEAMFAFLPTRARLDLAGWDEIDLFAH